jgi:DNA-binding NarL/FixJ family response regulator
MSTTNSIRILVVEDHNVVRDGLVRLLNAQADMEVIAEATDGLMAVERARSLKPDVILMDISMPRCSGARATTEVLRQYPQARIIALSMHEEPGYLRELMAAGALGYVLKRSATDDLLRAVRTVAGGGIFFDAALTGKVVRAFLQKSTLKGEIQGNDLSEREATVLRLLAQGYSHKEIAAQLSLSIKTVETYKARSMEKLSLQSRVDVVRYAHNCGWLDDF